MATVDDDAEAWEPVDSEKEPMFWALVAGYETYLPDDYALPVRLRDVLERLTPIGWKLQTPDRLSPKDWEAYFNSIKYGPDENQVEFITVNEEGKTEDPNEFDLDRLLGNIRLRKEPIGRSMMRDNLPRRMQLWKNRNATIHIREAPDQSYHAKDIFVDGPLYRLTTKRNINETSEDNIHESYVIRDVFYHTQDKCGFCEFDHLYAGFTVKIIQGQSTP